MIRLFILILCFCFVSVKGQSDLDEAILTEMNASNFPSLSMSIVKNGEVLWSNAFGFANVEAEIEATYDETIYTVASISKLIVGTTFLQLQEDGLLNLDDPISDYLPFSITHPYFSNQAITIRNVLQHRAGFKDNEAHLLTGQVQWADANYDLETFVFNWFAEDGLYYSESHFYELVPPGGNFHYSNLGFAVLGLIVESITDQSFSAYSQDHIFDPLCMNNTSWFLSDTNTEYLAHNYTGTTGNFQSLGYYTYPVYTAGLLKTTAEDLSAFLATYTLEGTLNETELLSESAIDELCPSDFSQGIAWLHTSHTFWSTSAANCFSHDGFIDGIRTLIEFYPLENSGLIILGNGEGNYLAIRNLMRAAMEEMSSDELPISLCETSNLTLASEHDRILISPNPVEDEVCICSSSGQNIQEISLSDLQGTQVYQESFEKQTPCQWINLGEIAGNGIILGQITTTNGFERAVKLYKL